VTAGMSSRKRPWRNGRGETVAAKRLGRNGWGETVGAKLS
jgi:hypothetical protein